MRLTIKVLSSGILASLKTFGSNSKIKNLIIALLDINPQNGKQTDQKGWDEVVKCLKEINFSTISDLDLVIIIVCLFVAIANSRCPELISALKYIFNNWCTNKKGESVNFIKAIADGDGVSLYNIFSYGYVFDNRILYPIGITGGGKFSKKFLGRVKRIRKWVLPESKKTINEVIVPMLNDMTGQTGKKNGLESGSPELFKLTVNHLGNFYKLEELRRVLRSVTIANTIKDIPSRAFLNFTNLSHVDIGNSVKYIWESAFAGCNSLKTITIPGSVETIWEGAFHNCASLENVTIKYGVQHIHKRAFADCDSLKTITIPGSVIIIDEDAFRNCASLENVTIKNGVIDIDKEAFADCKNLKTTTISGSVIDIKEGAFRNCASLENVTIKNGVGLDIGKEAFADCKNLREITIPGSVTNISSEAFSGCENLRKVTIENGVKARAIDDDAFKNCKSLKRLRFPASLRYIPLQAFNGCPMYDIINRNINKIAAAINRGKGGEIAEDQFYAQNQPSGISSENQ